MLSKAEPAILELLVALILSFTGDNMKTEKERTREVGNEESYSATLEAYYSDLLLKEKAGRISSASHQALDTFLRELRELVAESQAAQLPKAA